MAVSGVRPGFDPPQLLTGTNPGPSTGPSFAFRVRGPWLGSSSSPQSCGRRHIGLPAAELNCRIQEQESIAAGSVRSQKPWGSRLDGVTLRIEASYASS